MRLLKVWIFVAYYIESSLLFTARDRNYKATLIILKSIPSRCALGRIGVVARCHH
jgi:hypothetical protein